MNFQTNITFTLALSSLFGCGVDQFSMVYDPGDSAADGGFTDALAVDGQGDGDPSDGGSGGDVTTIGDGGLGDASDGGGAAFRRVFITSSTYEANFGGLAGGDNICSSVASGAGLSGTWAAWLSSSTVSAASRLEHATVPYELLNGEVLAADWTELTSGSLRHPIDHDEHDSLVPTPMPPQYTRIWTGTQPDGTGLGMTYLTCDDWTYSIASGSAAYSAVIGQNVYGEDGGAVNSFWTYSGSQGCYNMWASSLYCIEQF